MMPQTARSQSIRSYGYPQSYTYADVPVRTRPIKKKKTSKRVKRGKNSFIKIISLLLSCTFMFLIGYYVLPFAFHRISQPLLFGHNYSKIKTDYYTLMLPTTNYLANHIFMNKRSLMPVSKKPLMTRIYKTERMTILEEALIELGKKFPSVSPAVMVWDFNTGKYVDINADKIYSAASIIKIPVLIHLFKSIENNELSIYDEMRMTKYYKAGGSGKIQYDPNGRKYTIDKLAKIMIEDSDNSATNMLMANTGSMTGVNAAMKKWGIKKTHVQTWLPDLGGTNYTTASDIATMLFNLDNPSFLNITSREYIIDYMSHVKNNRLIPQGLGKGAVFIHKTGDIGKMLGDAGIVYMPNGKKYIVVILANRPYNSPQGKNYIQSASKLIYESMSKLY